MTSKIFDRLVCLLKRRILQECRICNKFKSKWGSKGRHKMLTCAIHIKIQNGEKSQTPFEKYNSKWNIY